MAMSVDVEAVMDLQRSARDRVMSRMAGHEPGVPNFMREEIRELPDSLGDAADELRSRIARARYQLTSVEMTLNRIAAAE